MSDWKDVWDGESRATKGQLRDFDRDFVIDFTRNSVRGALPNGNLAPLDFNSPILFTGILTVDKGGTSADFSATGPGVVKQTSVGAALTIGGVEYTDVDWASGTADHGQPLLYDNTGPTAEFGALNLASSLVTTGLLPGSRGGTGVNNGSNELTIPATGTAALLGTADQAFTENNSFAKILRAHNTSGTTGYGLRIWDGTNDWGNLQALDLSGNSFLFFSLNRYYDGSAWQQFNTRVGSSFQLTNDSFNFYTFPASSNVTTSRLGVTGAGVTTVNLGDAATNAASNLLILQHNSSGTPAAGYGSTILTRLASSTTDDQSAATDITTWATATHASRKARRVFNIFDTAAREALRIEASGTAPMIGFLGAAAIARPTVTGSRGGNAALASALTALANLGLITDSSS